MKEYKLNKSQGNNPNRWLDYSLFHSLRDFIKPLLYIPRDDEFLPYLTSIQQSLGLNIRFTKSNRPYLPSKSNRPFINQLHKVGFFDVFSTNNAFDDHNSFGVYLSQVVMFLHYGIDWVRKGFKLNADSIEIHHINSNVCDNRSSNLSIVTKSLHSFLTSLQIGQPRSYCDYVDFSGHDPRILDNKGNSLSGQAASSHVGLLIYNTLHSSQEWFKSILSRCAYQLDPNDPLFSSLPFSHDEYLPLDSSPEKSTLSLSFNWLLPRSIPFIPTIHKNLKSTLSSFIHSLFSQLDCSFIYHSLCS